MTKQRIAETKRERERQNSPYVVVQISISGRPDGGVGAMSALQPVAAKISRGEPLGIINPESCSERGSKWRTVRKHTDMRCSEYIRMPSNMSCQGETYRNGCSSARECVETTSGERSAGRRAQYSVLLLYIAQSARTGSYESPYTRTRGLRRSHYMRAR